MKLEAVVFGGGGGGQGRGKHKMVLLHSNFVAFYASPLPAFFSRGNSKIIPCYCPALDGSSVGFRSQSMNVAMLGRNSLTLQILPVSL